MKVKERKLVLGLSGGGFALVLICAVLHFVLDIGRVYELRLPDFSQLKAVKLTPKDGGEIELEDAYAEDVLFLLRGSGRTTKTESIQDAPVNVDDWIKVDMEFYGGGASTVFVYGRPGSRNGEFFIEQPYNGVYMVSQKEYQLIERYLS